jgi:hypothetical protein
VYFLLPILLLPLKPPNFHSYHTKNGKRKHAEDTSPLGDHFWSVRRIVVPKSSAVNSLKLASGIRILRNVDDCIRPCTLRMDFSTALL